MYFYAMRYHHVTYGNVLFCNLVDLTNIELKISNIIKEAFEGLAVVEIPQETFYKNIHICVKCKNKKKSKMAVKENGIISAPHPHLQQPESANHFPLPSDIHLYVT